MSDDSLQLPDTRASAQGEVSECFSLVVRSRQIGNTSRVEQELRDLLQQVANNSALSVYTSPSLHPPQGHALPWPWPEDPHLLRFGTPEFDEIMFGRFLPTSPEEQPALPIMLGPLDVLIGARAVGSAGFSFNDLMRAFSSSPPQEEPAPYEPGTRQWLDWRITRHFDGHSGIPGTRSYSSSGYCGICGACLVCGNQHQDVCPEWNTIRAGTESSPPEKTGLSPEETGETRSLLNGSPDQ